jgi:hypothetical protein
MRSTTPLFPARCTLHVGEQVLAALPIHIDGQTASVVVAAPPRHARPARLLVDWDEGGCTELVGRVRGDAAEHGVTNLEVSAVGGDWQPFLAWLGHKATA